MLCGHLCGLLCGAEKDVCRGEIEESRTQGPTAAGLTNLSKYPFPCALYLMCFFVGV